MSFSSIVRALARSPLTTEFISKLNRQQELRLNGISRLPKGLVASALAQAQGKDLFVVCATLEEAGRVYAQLEAMGWQTVHFYPTSEASPYEPFDPETEMSWGQMQVLADLVKSQESLVISHLSLETDQGQRTNDKFSDRGYSRGAATTFTATRGFWAILSDSEAGDGIRLEWLQ